MKASSTHYFRSNWKCSQCPIYCIYLFLLCDPQIIPLFLSLQVSVARYRANYDQLPLSSLTDDAPRGDNVGGHYHLPEGDTAANEDWVETVDIDTRERSCVESSHVIFCSGAKYRIFTCRKSSLISCHSSIPYSGFKKCKPVYTFFRKCGNSISHEMHLCILTVVGFFGNQAY